MYIRSEYVCIKIIVCKDSACPQTILSNILLRKMVWNPVWNSCSCMIVFFSLQCNYFKEQVRNYCHQLDTLNISVSITKANKIHRWFKCQEFQTEAWTKLREHVRDAEDLRHHQDWGSITSTGTEIMLPEINDTGRKRKGHLVVL